MIENDNDNEGNGAVGAALIAGGLSLANNFATGIFNGAQAEKQREWNERMINQQNQWSLEQWNRTNEYNSPSAQVQRLRDAGLNPLYYNLDGSSAQSFQSAQPLGYERANISSLQNPIVDAYDTAMKVAQISNIQADTAKKNNENLTETQKREKLIAEIEVEKEKLNTQLADTSLRKEQRNEILKKLEWADRLNQAVLDKDTAAAKLDESTKKRIDELLRGEKLIQSKTLEDFDKRWQKIDAEIEKISAETGLLKEDIANYALNHAQSGFMGSGISLVNLLRADKESRRHPREYYNTYEGSGVR